MKKILLSTTIVAGLLSGSALAHMDVKLGGSVEFQAGFKNETKEYIGEDTKLTPNQKNHKFLTKVQTYVKVAKKSDNGLRYGGVVSLHSNGKNDNGGNNKNHIFVEGGFGSLKFGQLKSPSYTMAIHAGSIASATGGIDGDFGNFLHGPGVGTLITSPDTLISLIDTNEGGQRKNSISYYSPKMQGFQIGVSFAPDTQSDTERFNFSNSKKNVISLGASYEHRASDNLNFAFAAVADKASTSTDGGDEDNFSQYRSIFSYQLGGKVSYQGLSFAASYGNHGKAFNFKKFVDNGVDKTSKLNAGRKTPHFLTAGLAYAQGPVSTSLTYMKSKDVISTKFNAISLGVDYAAAKGFLPYAEFTKVSVSSDALKRTHDNKKYSASVFLLGAKLSF